LELKLNRLHQLLAYVDVNPLGINIDTVKKNTETAIDNSKEVGLEVNSEKTKYVYTFVYRCQNAGHIHYMKIIDKSFENVAQVNDGWGESCSTEMHE
jgi:hypothetical protein